MKDFELYQITKQIKDNENRILLNEKLNEVLYSASVLVLTFSVQLLTLNF